MVLTLNEADSQAQPIWGPEHLQQPRPQFGCCLIVPLKRSVESDLYHSSAPPTMNLLRAKDTPNRISQCAERHWRNTGLFENRTCNSIYDGSQRLYGLISWI